MMKRSALLAIIATIILASCNFPTPGSQIGPEVQTAAAQTVQAALATPLSSPTALPGGDGGVTQSSAPILTVEGNTNCRSGPGTNYQILTVLGAGSSVPIVAKHPSGNFWVVDPPNQSENCWVAAELGTVTGNTSGVPEVTPVAEAGDGAPKRPGSLFYDYVCSGGTVSTTLTWTDAANNENGYRVYRNDVVIADLPPNSTQYVDEVSGGGTTKWRFLVEAYNSAGASPPRTAEFSCQ